MRRLFFFLIATIAMPYFVMAQINVTETFNADDKLRFDWEEYADKKGSAIISDGQLVLTCKEDNNSRAVYVSLPIDVTSDFKISSNLIVERISENGMFAVSFDNNDFVKLGIFLSENRAFIGYYENVVDYYGEKEASNSSFKLLKGEERVIKLKGGKNQTVNVVLEKKGKRLFFYVNNMKVYEKVNKSSDFFVAPYLGFITSGESVLKIDEVKVVQNGRN